MNKTDKIQKALKNGDETKEKIRFAKKRLKEVQSSCTGLEKIMGFPFFMKESFRLNYYIFKLSMMQILVRKVWNVK